MNPIYTVGSIKTFRGHDGPGCYSCNILKNGKKVAEVLEDGWGGGLQIQWLDKTSADVTCRTYDDKENTFKGTVEQALFYAEVMKMPKIPEHNGMPEMHTSVDIVIDDMVNDTIALKKIAADLKKSVTIAEGKKILTWKITVQHPLEMLMAHVKNKYPNAKILNSLPIAEVFKVYKEANLLG